MRLNKASKGVVKQTKQMFADLWDHMAAIENSEVSKTYNKSPEELKRLSGEKLRLISKTKEKIEEACMWAVKAITT